MEELAGPRATGGIGLARLGRADLRPLLARFRGDRGLDMDKPRALWAHYLRAQRRGRLEVVIARLAGRVAGYGALDRRPRSLPFRQVGRPEIADLNVHPDCRRQGVATALIAEIEARARAEGFAAIGLSVPVSSDYGPAQRLYGRLGYRPDGSGVSWRGGPVLPGATVSLDPDLCLHFIKSLE